MSLTGPPGEAVRVGNWLSTDPAMEPGNEYSHGEKARYPEQKRLALNMWSLYLTLARKTGGQVKNRPWLTQSPLGSEPWWDTPGLFSSGLEESKPVQMLPPSTNYSMPEVKEDWIWWCSCALWIRTEGRCWGHLKLIKLVSPHWRQRAPRRCLCLESEHFREFPVLFVCDGLVLSLYLWLAWKSPCKPD